MNAAPSFNCSLCARRIGKAANHWVLAEVLCRVICTRCMDKHDLYDKYRANGTRAGIASYLGLWPHPEVA